MEEDITNTERDVRMKRAESKELERRFEEEMEFKGAELKQLLKSEEEAREAREGLTKGKNAAMLFGEVMANAETSMREIAEELDEFSHLFQEEEEDKKKMTSAAILKRARTRQSESEGGGTPIPPSVEKKKPVPKKLPEAQKLKMMKKEEERKLNEEKMRDLKERLEKAKDEKAKEMEMGSQRPSGPKGSPRSKSDLSQVRPEWLIQKERPDKAMKSGSEGGSERSDRKEKEKKKGTTKCQHAFTVSSLATRPRSARR